jgi:hypothetical protein
MCIGVLSYRAWASPNPLCVLIEVLIPGKRDGLKSSRKNSASVMIR